MVLKSASKLQTASKLSVKDSACCRYPKRRGRRQDTKNPPKGRVRCILSAVYASSAPV
ncbi:hypothetical protein HMPREF9120_02353 [Neisseria sp. oral taxon 020 str. F0370]|nr:hypothetical protein HMPREF9120_02353 [Neisseria sp. oral taxon 020 str. F0370]